MNIWNIYYLITFVLLAALGLYFGLMLIRLLSSKKANNLVDLYFDSLRIYILKNDEEAAAAVILIFNIFGEGDRLKIYDATMSYIDKLLASNDLTDEFKARCKDLKVQLKIIYSNPMASVVNTTIMKNEAAEKFPDLVAAINKFDSSYLNKKHPDCS